MKNVVLLVLALMVVGGCPNRQIHVHKSGQQVRVKTKTRRAKKAKHAKHMYWYYPKAEVYYSPATKVYTVIDDGKWVSVAVPPTVLSTGSGSSHVTIESDTDKPWLKHSHHKKKHPSK